VTDIAIMQCSRKMYFYRPKN